MDYINAMVEILQSTLFVTWVSSLKDREARLHINARLLRMEDGNLGDIASVGGGVSEARIHYGPGYRLYFIRRGDLLIIMLAGGNKSTQPKDIKRARQFAEQWS